MLYKYTSQRDDVATGLMYYKARYYDPGIGRFITPDNLIGNTDSSQSYNRYSYAENNPIENNDPRGHLPGAVIGAIVGAVVGFVVGGTHGDILRPNRWGHMRWDWKAAAAGAVVGAAVGAYIGSGLAVGWGDSWTIALGKSLVGGSLNAYYASRRNGSLTDCTVAFAIGWGMTFAFQNPGEEMGKSLAIHEGGGFLGYGQVGAMNQLGTSYLTQIYFSVKRGKIREFKLGDIYIAAFSGFIAGGFDAYGYAGLGVQITLGAIIYPYDWQQNKEKYKKNYNEKIKPHLPFANQNSDSMRELSLSTDCSYLPTLLIGTNAGIKESKPIYELIQ